MFQFKQFKIEQDRCAMKVGTDSILLGSWTKTESAGKVLDIGAGTGILSLMMAQRIPLANIDAVECEILAANQCKENCSQSPWGNRIQIFQTLIQDFSPGYLYDLIISNPPFFPDDLESLSEKRSLARQGVGLSMFDLMGEVDRFLSPKGLASLVLPYSSRLKLEEVLIRYPLFLHRICLVYPREEKEPKRILVLLGREQKTIVEESLLIQIGGANEYSAAYKRLTKDFYLDLP